MQPREKVVLIDLPTFPKGILALSLINVAGCLAPLFDIEIIDLNFAHLDTIRVPAEVKFVGLKVSSQNIESAKSVTGKLKQENSSRTVFWGGELPTLLPEECLKYADTIVSGLFEPVASEFIADLRNNALKRKYYGANDGHMHLIPPPHFELVSNLDSYYSFMGLPMETSRGCTEKCAFCMVHVMQKKNYYTRDIHTLQKIAARYNNHFVNIVDYNFGVDKQHVIKVAGILKNSGVRGWMAEMCIEFLEDDELLTALKDSGCRIVYCGLESIEDSALATVHKMNTNHVNNYERIIRKAQSYGIQIGAGIIVGMENMNKSTFDNLYNYFSNLGLIYAKLTFLTYNPGTKVYEYMKKKGNYTTDDISKYDGNHFSYAPRGINTREVYDGVENFITRFYSFTNIIRRSFNTKMEWRRRCEFVLFNLCYRKTYMKWMEYDIFNSEEGFEKMLNTPMEKKWGIKFYEKLLHTLRKPVCQL
ncbi:MAG TPA: radical SAM protein [Chitinophagales bacterium]|nr:radical SAM protein [Chitinophagales bacterium]